ncbi:MAG: ferritin family protein [Candidatus Cloacimonadota bacterium]|nr:ferritin family protein [Candidatus Cloacimonadota bacterium]
MDSKKFNEIIDFAVDKEKEAVEFYQDLQTKAKFKAQKEMLKELENMEKGHIIILNQLRKKGYDIVSEKKEVPDLKISNYIVNVEPSQNMSYQDILIVAMKREEASKNLYTDLAAKLEAREAQQVFQRLAQEEARHKLKFEKLYDEQVLKDN